eukprot:500070-Pleurochrysis_carterae.AAC.1
MVTNGSRIGKTPALNTKLPPHRGHYSHRTQSARDRQPRTRAPEGAGKRRAGRAREHMRSACVDG